MKKIMILGAGSGQVPFLKISKAFGAKVIVITPKGDYEGIVLADKVFYCDTRDKEKILVIAIQEKIDAIITDQTDVSVPSVAYVAEKMGLKGIGYEKALQFTDKYLMRCAAKKIGVKVPHFGEAASLEEVLELVKTMKFPIMIKPADSSGSRGVCKVNSVECVEENFYESIRFSGRKKVIVEEFITGVEYLVDGLALDNEYINTDIGIKEYFNIENTYISKMCMFSSAKEISDEIEKKVLETNRKLVTGMRLDFGITHGEYIYCPEDEEVYLVEIAARGGGVFLSSHLTPLATGIDTNTMIVSHVLGEKNQKLSELKYLNKVSAWRCFELVPGIVKKIEGIDEVEKIEGVEKVCLDKLYLGKRIEKLKDDTGKMGPILVCADTRKECANIIKKIENTLKIWTEQDGIVSDIRW